MNLPRRNFIRQSSLLALGLSAFGFTRNYTAADLRVNGQRIRSRIDELAKFGKDASGRGYRVAYSKGDIEGRAWFSALMRKAKLDVRIDEAGNIIGKRNGSDASLKPLASVHISTWFPTAAITTEHSDRSAHWK